MKTAKINKTEFIAEISAKLLNGEQITKTEGQLYAKLMNEAKQSEAKQSKAKQSKAKQSKAKQSKAKQSEAKQTNDVADLVYRLNLEDNGFDLGEIHIVDYFSEATNKTSIGIFGDTKPFKDILFALGAKFNRFLSYGKNKQSGFVVNSKLIDKGTIKTRLEQFAGEKISYINVE